jgi:hypothetical protein
LYSKNIKGVSWDKCYCNKNINTTYHLVKQKLWICTGTCQIIMKKKVWKREIQCHIDNIINISKDQLSTELYLISMLVVKYKLLILIKQIQNNAIYTSGQMLIQYILWTTFFKLYLPRVLGGVRVTQSLVWCACFVDCCLSFCTAIVLSVLRYTDLYYPFGIFNLFYSIVQYSHGHAMINHCDRPISDTDIFFGLFNLFTYFDMPFGW